MRVRNWLVTSLILALSAAPVKAAAASASVYLNERQLFLPAPTVIKDDRLLVPMRGFIESMGGEVEWTPPGRITARLNGQTVTMTIGSREATAGRRTVQLDVPAQLIGDRTYIPVRFMSEGLGAQVAWDGAAVRLSYAAKPQLQVIDGPLNVRSAPSIAASVLTSVPVATRFEMLAEQGAWAQVQLPRGQTGWISTQYTQKVAPPPSAAAYEKLLSQGTGYLEVQGTCLGAVPIVDGKLYVPVRPVVERLGGESRWEEGATLVRYQGREVQVNPDTNLAVGDQILTPARELADALGVQLDWDAARSTASVGGVGSSSPCNPKLSVAAYYIMDAGTGVVLGQQAGNQARPIASTTKIMTAMLALERSRLTDMVTVSPFAAATDGTRMGLRKWQRVSMQELLYGLMLPSGNDAAVAISEFISGSEAAFAKLMNQRAVQLGAVDTLFYTASGLDDFVNPFSTARDLAVIARAAMADPYFRTFAGAKQYTLTTGSKLVNKNDFVLNYAGATGVKNGWTEKAGHTLVASATKNGAEVIVVVLGAASREMLYQTAYSLMDRGFALRAGAWWAL